MDQSCIFCKILAGEVPATFAYRDERVAAIADVNPKAPKVLMVRAAAIGTFDLIGDWEQEMLKYGQAISHDKIACTQVKEREAFGSVPITDAHIH